MSVYTRYSILPALALFVSPANALVNVSVSGNCDSGYSKYYSSNVSDLSVESVGETGNASSQAVRFSSLSASAEADGISLSCGWVGGAFSSETIGVFGLELGQSIAATLYIDPIIRMSAYALDSSLFGAASIEYYARSSQGVIGKDEFLYHNNGELIHFSTRAGPIKRDIFLPVLLGQFEFLDIGITARSAGTIGAGGTAEISLSNFDRPFGKFFVEDTDPIDLSQISVQIGTGFRSEIYRRSELFPIIHGSVPESSVWSFLISGFGLIGLFMRRNRTSHLKLSKLG